MKTQHIPVAKVLVATSVMILALARGQSPSEGNPSAAGPIGYSTVQFISSNDSSAVIAEPKNPAGYYGDGSSNVVSVIPTEPASFKTNPSLGRTPPPGFSSYTYEVDDYNRY